MALRRIVVHCEDEHTRVALLEEERLVEYDFERPIERQKAGSIYIGRVVNVIPGMQAAFIDIGLEKNAFLYIDDLLPAHLEKQPEVKPQITDLLKTGQKLMVQVIKEPSGTKGARVTTHYSIPGRLLVYMPEADYIAVSRKIESDVEKKRLRTLAEELRQGEEGIILRTVSAGQQQDALHQDLNMLRERWNAIASAAETAAVPSRIYSDADLLTRIIRDWFNEDVSDIVVNSPAAEEELQGLLRQLSPSFASRVRLDQGSEPVFDKYGVNEQLDKAFRRKVWLPSGGYLVIDHTEALTVIDVNSGKYTGSVALEETAFDINLEAVLEIARILRLRNIGGIVIVDFIDMERESNRQAVLERMEQAVKRDRIKTTVVGWTKLGLLELTRKKSRENWTELFCRPCPVCQGKGKVFP
jgi:ribonuclease G